MSKPVKEMVAAELREKYSDVIDVCVVSMAGLDIVAQEKIRGMLREKSSRVEVVRNSLARRAFAGTALEPVAAAMEGPCALVTGGSSAIEMAKTLVEAAKEYDQFELKHAMLEGESDLFTVHEASKLAGKGELLGEVAMLVASPARAIAGCLSSPQSKVAGCLKAIIEKAA